MKRYWIEGARVINEGKTFFASVLTEGNRIAKVVPREIPFKAPEDAERIDAYGCYLLPGVIDDQVHFRDPGLTYKGDIETESKAAIAGGVTSFMDMPNTKPQTTTITDLLAKYERASQVSYANYAFFMGATNDNLEEVKQANSSFVPGVKIFMGSSTGNMLVDNKETLERIFSQVKKLIAVHSEKESIIQANIARYKSLYGDDLDIHYHPLIRSEEACYLSSLEAVEMAKRFDTRLHLLHLSTAREIELLENKPLNAKMITGEVCVHHLWFSDQDYDRYGNRIKWNPSIKTIYDRNALREGLREGYIDIAATDHAPHLLSEKEGSCLKAASGGPLVQHSLVAMLELAEQGIFTKEMVVEKMAHAPAGLFGIPDRGYIREGYYADLVIVRPEDPWTVQPENILYKCGWSPFEGTTFRNRVLKTFINGTLAYNEGEINKVRTAMPLHFSR
ncbi:MAG: dihydroorotase [Bacteroidales bacterium]|nr:dihydroorotase [Bacteroidales bacterium]